MTEISRDIYFSFDFYQSLKFHNIGHSVCMPHHFYGPHDRDQYILHFVSSGQGIFEVDNIRYHLKENQFFLIRPGKWTYYEADGENPWTYSWISFSGDEVAPILKKIGFLEPIPIGSIEQPLLLKEAFSTIFQLIDTNNQNLLFIQAKLLELLSLFSQNIVENTEQYQNSEKLYSNPYLQLFFDYISRNYDNTDLKIDDISDSLAIHRSYLNRIIKKELSQTPSEYLLKFRMNKSILLLESSNLTIDEIANIVGYQNPYSFSRAFSLVKGISPSKYRKRFYDNHD